tara:strand:+ start:370 stop:1599 length:1230 start_codon:yes stop_codon:yes gene_type:complete
MANKEDQYTVLPNKARLYKQSGSKRFYVAIKLNNGKWERKSTGTEDLAQAKEKASALYWEAQALAAHNLPQATRTFSSVAKSVVAELEGTKETHDWKQVYKHYIGVINSYQIPYFGRTRLDNIRPKYKGYQAYVTKELGRQPSQSTIATHNSALKLIFDKAVDAGYMTQLSVPRLDTRGSSSQRRPTFELSEYRNLLNKLRAWKKKPTHRIKDAEIRQLLYDYVMFLANTGIRHGREAMDLKWQDLSFKKSIRGNELVVFRVLKKKGRKATQLWRDVVMRNPYGNAINILNRLKDRQAATSGFTVEQLIASRNGAKIFALSDGAQPARMDGTFKKFLHESGLTFGYENKPRTLYSWRHFYATVELTRRKNINIALLARQMGTSIAMLEKHYGHLDVVKYGDALSGRTEW